MEGGDDKFELSKYLTASKQYNILEIGPGAGSVIKNAISLSKSWHNKDQYHVLDLDIGILTQLYDDEVLSKWPAIFPVQANALYLPYKGLSFDFINLSAVAHEISSYAGGFAGLKQLAQECSRVLKIGGVLLFRELEGVSLQDMTECNVVGHQAIAFFCIFYKRFIDLRYTDVNKPIYYDKTKIAIEIVNGDNSVGFNFDNITPNSLIKIKAPSGFIREVQRHFLTFVDAFAPEYFHEVKKSLDKNERVLVFSKKSAEKGFLEFAQSNNIDYFRIEGKTYQVTISAIDLFEKFIDSKFLKIITDRCVVPTNTRLKEVLIKEQIVFEKSDNFLKIPSGAVIYLHNILEQEGLSIKNIDESIIRWSKREGDEHYFFGELTDMLINFITNSVRVEHPHSGILSGFTCLVPIDSRYVPRSKYIDVLHKSFTSINGNADSAKLEGKRIINFKKLPIELGIHQISQFFYCNDNILHVDKIIPLIKKLESYVRDFVSRSLKFNKEMKKVVTELDPFFSDILLLEDEIENIGQATDIKNNLDKNFLLVGRLATKKESFRLYFKNQGFEIINLTDILSKHINKPMPNRKDLYETGTKLKKEYGPAFLAKLAVDQMNQSPHLKYLVLGCRSPHEIKYIKDKFKKIMVLGLFPDEQSLITRLKKRYPQIDEEAFSKWIDWDDGKDFDQYTNIKICMQLCDILFCGVDDKIVERNCNCFASVGNGE